MTSVALLGQILDHANRADPYPLYAELRRTPVVRDESGPYLVSTYWEIHSLLHDPRVSSDVRHLAPGARTLAGTDDPELPPSFIRLDPPDHDRLRRLIMRTYGPPHTPRRVYDLRGEISGIVSGLIDRFQGRDRIDLVEDFSYPFPVTVICRLLGVPPGGRAALPRLGRHRGHRPRAALRHARGATGPPGGHPGRPAPARRLSLRSDRAAPPRAPGRHDLRPGHRARDRRESDVPVRDAQQSDAAADRRP
ncbi:hypothetical protein GCM10009578_023030 [Streptomyces rhizosphaericus]